MIPAMESQTAVFWLFGFYSTGQAPFCSCSFCSSPLDTQFLWAQQVVQDGEATVKKVDGEKNAADLNTKHVGQEKFWRFMAEMGFVEKAGRSKLAKSVQGNG